MTGSLPDSVVQAIPHGRNNAISRAMLRQQLNVSDREMRRAIEEARQNGTLIISHSDGSGYYIAEDISEIRAQYWREKSRLKHIYASSKPLRDILKAAGERV